MGRRNGLLKKAKELSVLCDLDIGVVVYSCRGKLYHYSNTGSSLTEILGRYHSSVTKDCSSPDREEGQGHGQGEKSKYSEFMTCGELLKIVEREEEVEHQLENALIQTTSAKVRGHLLSPSQSPSELIAAAAAAANLHIHLHLHLHLLLPCGIYIIGVGFLYVCHLFVS